ncbi:hypothetical protein BJY21_000473 [Kineosphaera limosa]|uniref:hypothetical protein n=1 Tax=Kineosphaera limosa TaxID=111564 RepID=UPI0012F8B263|nr:hypothetical protein [Kineosphaera limosa]NYD99288.1 hypothetical protein [Kineosphaera limosa]
MIRADSGASTRMESFSPTQGRYDREAARRPGPLGDLDHLTDSDLDLIYAVTGERIFRPTPHGRPAQAVTPFTRQIAVDRRSGALLPHVEVSAQYLVRTGAVIEANGGVNPFTGLHLQRALAYLASRREGRIDVVC